VSRPRTTLIALAALAIGAGAAQLGSAQADSSTGPSGTTGTTGAGGPTQADTIVVNGTDTITIPTGSPSSTAQSTYQNALGGALTNASQKATFIASQIGATLGPIINVTETSDSSNLCQGPVLFAPGTAKPSTPATRRHKNKHAPLIRAIAEPIDSCSIEADVTVTYAMTPS